MNTFANRIFPSGFRMHFANLGFATEHWGTNSQIERFRRWYHVYCYGDLMSRASASQALAGLTRTILVEMETAVSNLPLVKCHEQARYVAELIDWCSPSELTLIAAFFDEEERRCFWEGMPN